MEKDNPQSLSISEVIDSKKRVYLMSKKSFVFRTPFRDQCVSGSKTLLKCAQQNSYPIFSSFPG